MPYFVDILSKFDFMEVFSLIYRVRREIWALNHKKMVFFT